LVIVDIAATVSYIQEISMSLELDTSVTSREIALQSALSRLEAGDFQQRWEISKILIKLGNIAIPPLIDILSDEDAEDELRWYVAKILGDLKDAEAIPPLVELLQTTDNEELQVMAASALGQIGIEAIGALCLLLADDTTGLLAVRSLAYIRHPETIVPLLSVVDNSQIAIRVTAIEALSSFHDERVVSVLLRAMDDQNDAVRLQAILALGFRPDLREQLDLVSKLKPKLYDSNSEVAHVAVLSLSRMGCDTASQHLYEFITSPQTPIKLQLEAIRALSWLGKVSALEYLQNLLNKVQSLTLWQQIVVVLGRIQQPNLTPKASEILLEMLRLPHPATEVGSVRSAIAFALGQLGSIQAIEPLQQLIADRDELVRIHAIASLKNLLPQ
jgi:HEAT repeat protein